MISSLIENLKCDYCNGMLEASEILTLEAYSTFTNLPVHNVSDAIEDMLNRFIVYSCAQCGAEHRHTFKDIERKFRIGIMKQVLNGVMRGEISPAAAHGTGALFYCGKCTGYDGQGSCPRSVLDKCEIKRLPNVF